jgi:tRNA(Ile)-lysidine synthase
MSPHAIAEPDWFQSVVSRVKDFRDRHGTHWILAVSGGSDSVAMLRILHRISESVEIRLVVAHLDHGTREGASRLDSEFVRDLAKELGLSFILGHWKHERCSHFESDARRARYEWLLSEAQRLGSSVVTVGHNREDQAETVLHRMIRGTGPRGLAGIPRHRTLGPGVELVRPILDVGKEQLKQFLRSLNQSWREDDTNQDLSRTRSRLRFDLLPKLVRDYKVDVVDSLTRLAGLTDSALTEMDKLVDVQMTTLVRTSQSGRVEIDRQGLRSLGDFLKLEVLRRAWKNTGWPEASMSERRWKQLVTWIEGEPAIHDAGGRVKVEVRDDLILMTRELRSLNPVTSAITQHFVIPGTTIFGGISIASRVGTRHELSFGRQSEPGIEVMDLDRITEPLELGHPRPGDRFDPLGLQDGSMALADFFRGRKVTRQERAIQIVLRDQKGIIWVVGHRISQRVRLTETTQRVVQLHWKKVNET